MAVNERTYSIGEVSKLSGVSTHTLRFYEQEGLFPDPIQRDGAGRRTYTEQETDWLQIGLKLRATGMPLPEIRRFAELTRAADDGVEERYRLLSEHGTRVRDQLTALQDVLTTIETKLAQYRKRLADGTATSIWTDGTKC